jgi:hypothetical protein
MNWLSFRRRVAAGIVTLSFLGWLTGFFAPVSILAEGGLALSGSFHNQKFVIPQGAAVSGPSIDVVVFNNGSEAINVRMLSQSPPGVTITFSQIAMVIPPGGQQPVLITVAVASDTAPGDYKLDVTAQSYREGGSGIQVSGGAGQTAPLTVTGEAARVALRALSPDGQPVAAAVRLFRLVNGISQEVAYSPDGFLEAIVAPGDFKAASYINGQPIAELTFSLAKGDNQKFDLSGPTVYFASFGVLPAFDQESGRLGFIQVVYTVKNLYQRVEKGEVVLQVAFNSQPSAPITLVTLSPLEVGSAGLNYNYTPAGGWVNGNYEFKLDLNLEGRLYTSSQVERLIVDKGGVKSAGPAASANPTTTVTVTGPATAVTASISPSSPAPSGGSRGVNPFLIGGAVALLAVLAVILVWWSKRK